MDQLNLLDRPTRNCAQRFFVSVERSVWLYEIEHYRRKNILTRLQRRSGTSW